MLIVLITSVCCCFFSTLYEYMKCYFTCPASLEPSHHISGTLEADRQAGEVILSGCITLRSSRCTKHTHARAHGRTHTHTIRGGKTGLGPPSERPSQNQLAFKLMKRVMKRVLSLPQNADRQAESRLRTKQHQRHSNGHFVFFLKEKNKAN